MRVSYFVYFVCSMVLPLQLFGQVRVVLHQPPPNQLKVEQLWWVDISNFSNNQYTVFLHAEIEENETGLIFKANTNTFTVPPGTKRIQAKDITDVRDVWYASEYREYIIRTGSVPEGTYTACIYIIDAITGAELAHHCITVTVLPIEPPRLISPRNGIELKPAHPLFSWTGAFPVPVGERVRYKIKIVELFDAQTPEQAMRMNTPWYEGAVMNQTTLTYPGGARPFDEQKKYIWQVQAVDQFDKPLGRNLGLSEIWEFNTGHLVAIDRLPKVLVMGDFVLKNITYEEGSTLEALSGKAESYFIEMVRSQYLSGPPRVPHEILFSVKFSRLRVSWEGGDTAYVTRGRISHDFRTPLELAVEQYWVMIHHIELLPESALVHVGVETPCLFEETGCEPAELGPIHTRGRPLFEMYELLPVRDRGPYRLGETGILITSTDEVEIDLERTMTPSKTGITFSHGETVEQPDMDTSNTGYLYGRYTFDDGAITPEGFSATLELADTWTFYSLIPMNFEITLEQGFLIIDSCKVMRGKYTAGSVMLPAAEHGVKNVSGDPIITNFDSLTVDTSLNISGIVKYDGEMRWGGFGLVNAGMIQARFMLPADPYPYFSLVQDDSFPQHMPDTDTLIGWVLGDGTSTIGMDSFVVYSEDANNPLILTRVELWLNLEMQGLRGYIAATVETDSIFEYLGNTGTSFYRATGRFRTGFQKSTIDSSFMKFWFAGNSAFDSYMNGQFIIPYPCNMKPTFHDMEVTSTAALAGGNVAFDDTLILDYWGVGITSKRGVVSVRVGEIAYTNAEIIEPVHFSKGFNIVWGEMFADGNLGEFYFNHNCAHQTFDGFPITLDSAALSHYDPAKPDIPGELVVRSGVHFNFFGEPDTIITIHDAKFADLTMPYYGRLVSIDPDSFALYREWGNGVAVFDFPGIQYDSVDQNGFNGTGHAGFGEFFPASSPFFARINIDSTAAAVCINEYATQQLMFPPFASIAGVEQIWGCAYIEGDEVHRVVVGGNLHSGAGVSLYAEGGTSVEVKIGVTPTISTFACHGTMYFGTLGANIEVNGRIYLSYDRAAHTLEGEIAGALDLGAIGIDVEADGQANWHIGTDTNYIQGRLRVKICALGSGVGMVGGVFLGYNAPKSRVWVLREGSSENRRFGVNMDNLPDFITGVYAFGDIDMTIGAVGIIEGGIEIYAGVGAFLNYNGTDGTHDPGLPYPYIIGIVGVYIHGEILWGLVSVSAWGELELYFGDPTGFEGTIGLRGCVLWVLCAEIEATVGWNSGRGFYIQ